MFIALLAFSSCKRYSSSGPSKQGVSIVSDDGQNKLGSVAIASFNDVASFLDLNCSKCHGVDSSGIKADFYTSWPMDGELLQEQKFKASPTLSAVYMSLLNSVNSKPAQTPKAMPVGVPITDSLKQEILSVLAWFELNLPLVVSESEETYQSSNQLRTVQASLGFQCTSKVSNRTFVNRLYLSAYDQPPTIRELNEVFLENSWRLDEPVTAEVKKHYVDELFHEKLASFKENGLLKLATAISGSSAITSHSQLKAAQVEDLQQEFYRSVIKHFDSWNYTNFFTANSVMVSSNTAPLYGCNVPSDKSTEWSECFMPPPREGFFTTFGFLNSKRSSFLSENNNYGRVASMYYVLQGQSFKAATNGPQGSDAAPLPKCIESADMRFRGAGPRGSAAVSLAGSVCQSCHLSRYLMAGSILMRPYSEIGRIYNSSNLISLDAALYREAVGSDWSHTLPPESKDVDSEAKSQRVDRSFLLGLLTSNPGVCIEGTKGTTTLTKVQDLAEELSRSEALVVQGFARHAHRAFMSSVDVSLELLSKLPSSYKEEKTVKDLSKNYFMSETFSCEVVK